MAEPKVVLQLIETSGIGGAETVLLELCRRLDRTKYLPVVVLLHEGWLNSQLAEYGIETLFVSNKRSYDFDCLGQIIDIIRRHKVDIVHSHEFMMNFYGAVASRITGKKHVMTIHGKNYYGEKLRRRLAYRLAASLASRVVAVSHDLSRYLVSALHFPNDKISVIHNGIDVERYAAESLNRRNKINGGPVIGAVGNVYPVKGHRFLIHAAVQILRRFPDTKFVIAGKITPHTDELMHEARALGVEHALNFAGFQDDVPRFLSEIDIFVLPSLQETFSLATVEAMAAGKPVVVTRCGGPVEIVNDGENGRTVPAQDAQALANAIIELLSDNDSAAQLTDMASKNVRDYFTLDSMVSRYEAIYESI